MTMSVAWRPWVMALRLEIFLPVSVLGPVPPRRPWDFWAFWRLVRHRADFSLVDIIVGPSFLLKGRLVFWGDLVGNLWEG